MTSKIEWTEQVWNPFIGCTKVSPGCENCYAEKMAARLSKIEVTSYYGSVVRDGKWNNQLAIIESSLEKPLKRKRPTVFFVGSMTDIFHEAVLDYWIDQVFAIIALCPQHRFIVLTKRPERMRRYLRDEETACRIVETEPFYEAYELINGEDDAMSPMQLRLAAQYEDGAHNVGEFENGKPLPNVILGVTAENQEQADKRIPILLDTPAAARFVSVEPMLGPVDLTEIGKGKPMSIDALRGRMESTAAISIDPSPAEEFPGLDWVICGGESGPGARPMHPDWVRSLRDQCASASVPFFFKQWGESVDDLNRNARANAKGAFWMIPDGTTGKAQPEPEGCVWMNRIGKKKAGNLLDGQKHEECPAILREVQNV